MATASARASALCLALLVAAAPTPALAQEVIYEDSFESGSLDPARWTARPSIEGAEGGLIEVVTSSEAPDGSFVLRIGRSSDGDQTTNALDLQLDLSGRDQVELRYFLLDSFDEEQTGEGIYFSDDGGATFTDEPVLSLDLDEDNANNVYLTPPPVDVDALAAANGLSLTSEFVVRFQQIGENDFSGTAADGFILDAVSVSVPDVEYVEVTPSSPFEDGFETGALGPMWQEAYASDPGQGAVTAPAFAPTRLGGIADVETSVNAPEGAFYLLLGRATDGELTTTALDLRLDLSGQDEIELRYTISNFFDETQEQEGLYFSDNGGATFVQVREYEVGEETGNVYFTPPPVDVDALAAANGLSLTSEFVVRFQQIGTDNFSGTAADGFILDDVVVLGGVVTPTDVEDGTVPGTLVLQQNYPNPFNPTTTIPFTLERPGEVSLAVFDLLGREVAVLIDGQRPAGAQEVGFEATGLPSGMYLYRLEAGGGGEMRRMMLAK